MSGRILAVLPVIGDTGPSAPAQACLASMAAPDCALGLTDADDLIVVDNTRTGLALGDVPLDRVELYRDRDGHNLGVAGSWNVGARRVLDEGHDYLLILSSVLLWGPTLHTTWREQMERFWGERVIECDGHSWHLIAFHRTVLEAVGLFDENFYPAYVEALDYSYRMRQRGWEGGWRRAWVNVLSQGHGLHIPLVACPWGPLDGYYRRKWGGPKGKEQYRLPFGVPGAPLDLWASTPIPVLAERYGLGERGQIGAWW